MLSRVTTQLLKTPKTSLVLCMLLFCTLGVMGTQLAIDPSFSSLISSEGEFNTNARILENAFGTNSAFEIIFSIDETTGLSQRPEVLSLEALENTTTTLASLLEESQYVTQVGSPQISENERFVRVSVSVFEPSTSDGVLVVREEIASYLSQTPLPPGVQADITGFPIILDRVSTLLITDNLTTVLITALLVFLVLLWYFKNFRLALIGVVSPFTSLAALAGVMVVLQIDITLTLAAVGVIVIGLGADYSIHLITAYTRNLRASNNPKKAILDSLDELELALTASFLTTAAGFAALMLGVSPSSQAQGQVLVIAITAIFIVTMLVLPLLLYLFVKTPPKGGSEAITFIDGIYSRLARVQARHPLRVIGAVFVVTVVLVFGAAQIGFSTSNSNWIPDDDPVAVSFREFSYAFGEEQSITIVVVSTQEDLRNPSTLRDLEELGEKLRGIPGVTRVQSPAFGLTQDPVTIDRLTQERQAQFNRDFTMTTVRVVGEGFLVDESGSSNFLQELRDITQSTAIHNAQTSLFGDTVRFSELGESLQQDTAITTAAGLVLVFVVATLLYTSFAVGIIALAPIVLAVIWAVGIKGFFGIPFTSLSTGIVSLVLGIGVDFSIHLVNATRNAQKTAKNLEEAITTALHTTGGAILLSSITTFFGFLALTFAALLGTQRLGWSLAFSILAVFVVTVVLVPTIIVLRQRVLKRRT